MSNNAFQLLCLQAAEIASRNQIRGRFKSSEDLIHRLFVCISGVADQLQTNFASDLRAILKAVFLINASQVEEEEDVEVDDEADSSGMEERWSSYSYVNSSSMSSFIAISSVLSVRFFVRPSL